MSPVSHPFGDNSSSGTPPVPTSEGNQDKPLIVGMKRKAPDSTNELLQSLMQRKLASTSKFKIPKFSSFLPLLRDSIPSVAAEIEAELSLNASKQGTTQDDYGLEQHGSTAAYPLALVDEDVIYDGPDDSGWESDDSNDENNPKFDYPSDEEFAAYEDEIEIDSSEQTDEDEKLEDGRRC